ncbi:hypothetical protein BJY52DRAFT_707235 [Lactarius psammicola]|nr:hypothetical protein BJY52DRAFT_707235 [Lactarius psammicola]
MNVLQTDYSNLFAAGLRVIESRSTGRGSSHPVSAVSSTNLNLSASDRESEEDFPAPIEVAPKKTSSFPTKLWRHVSLRREKSSSPNTSALAGGAKPRHRRWRSMLPGCVGQETALDARIWDWSTSVYHATTLPGEEDGEECTDPYLDDKVDPVDTPLPTRTAFLVALPSTAAPLWEHDFPVSLPSQHEQQHRRSLQMPRPRHPYSSPSFKEATTCQWELASASSHEGVGYRRRLASIPCRVDRLWCGRLQVSPASSSCGVVGCNSDHAAAWSTNHHAYSRPDTQQQRKSASIRDFRPRVGRGFGAAIFYPFIHHPLQFVHAH